MKFLDFQQCFQEFPVFGQADIQKTAPSVGAVQLSRWQKKGLIQRLINGFYRFPTPVHAEEDFGYIANKIYAPSYVTGQTVLSRAGLIPETIDVTVSMTTRTSVYFETPIGRFRYHHCLPRLFFGYHIEKGFGPLAVPVRVADKEKALLDFLYLETHLQTEAALEELRINPLSWQELDQEQIDLYLRLFDNKALSKRVSLLRSLMNKC